MDNYDSVVQQMLAFGVEFKTGEGLTIPTAKRKTCGVKGKWWYWLQLWRPQREDGSETGAEYVVGKFGCYKHHGSEQKVEIDFKPLTDAEKARYRAEREAAEARSRAIKAEAAALAALGAADLWRKASREGHSAYLERKGVQAEACRYLWDGSIVIPLLRYDRPRHEALRAVQRIYPGPRFNAAGDELPQKIFTKDFSKAGCALRLGAIDAYTDLVMVCEGYATGLSIRMATDRQVPVYVALDAYNLMFVVEILRSLHPGAHLLVCGDDDWKSEDHQGPNPGRRCAKQAAKTTERCDLVYPVFDPACRQLKDTDFNDLHIREGLPVVAEQLKSVMFSMRQRGAIG